MDREGVAIWWWRGWIPPPRRSRDGGGGERGHRAETTSLVVALSIPSEPPDVLRASARLWADAGLCGHSLRRSAPSSTAPPAPLVHGAAHERSVPAVYLLQGATSSSESYCNIYITYVTSVRSQYVQTTVLSSTTVRLGGVRDRVLCLVLVTDLRRRTSNMALGLL